MWKPGCLVIVEYINIVCWQTKAPIAHNFIHYPTIPNGLKALEAACRGPHRGVRKTPSQSMLASLMPMLLATGRNCRNWFIFFPQLTGTAKSKKGIPLHLSSFASSSVKGWKSLASAACHGQHAALTKIFILKLTHAQLLVVLKWSLLIFFWKSQMSSMKALIRLWNKNVFKDFKVHFDIPLISILTLAFSGTQPERRLSIGLLP
jgi:hypothetical protein